MLPDGALSLSGTNLNFGGLEAGSLATAGGAFLAEGATLTGELSLGPGLLDFAGTLLAEGSPRSVTLSAGAVLAGSGTLIAGSGQDAGVIQGPGTLLALGGGTLQVSAGGISGADELAIGGGGVLILQGEGQGNPLLVDSSVRVSFAPGYGVEPITGGYSDSLAQDGGVLVLDDPQNFSGDMIGFAAGDRIILPGLRNVSIAGSHAGSLLVSGINASGAMEEFALNLTIPSGNTLRIGTDAAGDAELGLGGQGSDLFLGGGSFGAATLDLGIGQSLPGLQVLLPDWTGQSLTLTLGVQAGTLACGSLTPGASLVLTAGSPAALNALLTQLSYAPRNGASTDMLAASGGGALSGLSATAPIFIPPAGTLSGFGTMPAQDQAVSLGGSPANLVLITQAGAPGEVIVTGAEDFANVLDAGGIDGPALVIDSGGVGLFDAVAVASFGADVVIGDGGGAGTLAVASADFTIANGSAGANLIIGGNSGAAGSAAEITGAVVVDGTIVLGSRAMASLETSGVVDGWATTIGSDGTLLGSGSATLALGILNDSGTLILANSAVASAQQLGLSGLLELEGDSSLYGPNGAVIAAGGLLKVGADATFSANGLNLEAGAILDQGKVFIGGNLALDSTVTLAGGTLEAALAALDGNGTLAGFGLLRAFGSAPIAVNGGRIQASGGVLALDGNVSIGAGGIGIAASASLELLGGISGGQISFTGTDAALRVSDPARLSASVEGMVAGDVIDLLGVAPSLVTYSRGIVSAKNAGGGTLTSFTLGTAVGQPAVSVVSDNAGGALITLGGELACFCGGTRLLTPNGYIPVEHLRPGDPVITRLGFRRAVRWIGRSTREPGPKAPREVRPVTVLPGAFGPNLPSRPVRLSPSHAIFVEGVLVPAMHLVNGATILQDQKRGKLYYYHVELDRHDVLMAEGLPVESYLDTGNRTEFEQEWGRRGSGTRPCAPLITKGPKLARIRRKLHEAALATGFEVIRAPELHGIAAGALVQPEMRPCAAGVLARFFLPPGAERLVLNARSATPAETDPDSDDRRELALCLAPPRNRRLRLGSGWHPRASGDAGIWMGARGEILIIQGVTAPALTLTFRDIAPRWRQPVDLLPQSFYGAASLPGTWTSRGGSRPL